MSGTVATTVRHAWQKACRIKSLGCVRRTFAMAFSPCLEKSLSNAQITASLSLLREPRQSSGRKVGDKTK
jgi:hypothetical protein